MDKRIKNCERQLLEFLREALEDGAIEIDIIEWAKEIMSMSLCENEEDGFNLIDLGITLIAYGNLHKKYGGITLEKLLKGDEI